MKECDNSTRKVHISSNVLLPIMSISRMVASYLTESATERLPNSDVYR
jgi:phage terminase large subunit-like protein